MRMMNATNEYDTHNLRYTANFVCEIFSGVNWVPVNMLGTTRYKKKDILSFLALCPEEKQSKIGSLYEAIQLLQYGRFKSCEDNISVVNDRIRWAIHTTGLNAVLHNSGCCATVANWLLYMLKDKYDEMGIISILSETGIGHAVNYFRHQEKLYVVDTNAYMYENREYVQPETGLLQDYRKNKILTAAMFQVNSLEDFTQFFSTFVGRVKRRKFLYCKHSSEITWEGYKLNSKKILETFWPQNNTSIIGEPPPVITTHMLSTVPFSLDGEGRYIV